MNRWQIALLALLGLLACGVSLVATSTGVGLGPDSYVYIAAARSLLAGDGLRIPQGPDSSVYTAHFPPLYASLLALSSLGAFDPQHTARWLNALFFGASVFLTGLSIWRLSGRVFPAAWLGALLCLASAEILLIHAQVWSEAPFFFLMLLGLLLLSRSLAAQGNAPLILSAAAIALACLARYAGITLAGAGALAVLLETRRGLAERARRAALFLAISLTPLGLWLLYNLAVAGSLTNRSLSRHPVSLRDLRQGATTVAGWLFPGVSLNPFLEILSMAAILAGLALLVASLLRADRHPEHANRHPERADRPPERSEGSPPQPYSLFSLVYVLFLLLSLSLLDAQTSLDARILSPVYIVALILVASALARWLPAAHKVARWLALSLLAVFTAAQLVSGVGMARGLYAGEDKGYTSAYWLNSKLIQQVRGLPDAIPIYSNGADAIYLLTGKPAIGLPQEISPNSLKVNPRFEQELLEMRRALEQHQGVLVVFYELEERRRYLPSEYELNELLPLKRVTRWKNEGALYRLQGASQP